MTGPIPGSSSSHGKAPPGYRRHYPHEPGPYPPYRSGPPPMGYNGPPPYGVPMHPYSIPPPPPPPPSDHWYDSRGGPPDGPRNTWYSPQTPQPPVRKHVPRDVNEQAYIYHDSPSIPSPAYALHRRRLEPPRNLQQPSWQVPGAEEYDTKEEDNTYATPTLKDSMEDNDEDGSVDADRKRGRESREEESDDEGCTPGRKKKEDSLSLLATVSSEMAPPKSRKKQQETSNQRHDEERSEKTEKASNSSNAKADRSLPSTQTGKAKQPPASPLNRVTPATKSPARRPVRPSVILTPSINSTNKQGTSSTNTRPLSNATPKPITPTGASYTSYAPRSDPSYRPPGAHTQYHGSAHRPPPTYEDTQHHGHSGYFGAQLNGRGGPPQAPSHYYHHTRDDSWSTPEYSPAGYPPYPSSPVVVEHNSFDSTDNSAGGSVPYERRYPYPHESEGYWRGTPPPPFPTYRPPHRVDGAPYPPPRWSYEGPPPGHPHMESMHEGPIPPHPYYHYPPSDHHHHHPSPEMVGGFAPHEGRSPYGPPYHPGISTNHDSRTMLRKKFSWKHYPELERFLIDNREEYLDHSARNYTIAQKQFNNQLTERLIKLAEKHNYVFDPEEFNFVAIRDRIRCYYKSYVQTIRKKRGPSHLDNHNTNNGGNGEDNSSKKRKEDVNG